MDASSLRRRRREGEKQPKPTNPTKARAPCSTTERVDAGAMFRAVCRLGQHASRRHSLKLATFDAERAATAISPPTPFAASAESPQRRPTSPRHARHYIGNGNAVADRDLQSTTDTWDKHSAQQCGATSLIVATFPKLSLYGWARLAGVITRFGMGQVQSPRSIKFGRVPIVPNRFQINRCNSFNAMFLNSGP